MNPNFIITILEKRGEESLKVVCMREFKSLSSIIRQIKGNVPSEKINNKKGTSLLFRNSSALEEAAYIIVNGCLESRNWG